MKTKLFIAILLNIYCSNANAQWVVKNTVTQRFIWHVSFTDATTVYAVGDSVLMKSTDGGNTWNDLLPNISFLGTNGKFYNLEFLNSDTGFIFRNANSKYLLRTTDGGITWNDVSSNVMPFGMFDINFVNSNTGFAVGNVGPDSIFAKTTDGGLTWSHLPLPSQIEIPLAVKFISNSIGFIGDYEIYKTNDGGQNWVMTNSDNGWVNSRITEYNFLDSQTGFAITDDRQLLKTTDAGENWKKVNIPVVGSWGCRGLAFDQNNFGFMVGFDIAEPLVSNDGGNSWFIEGSFPYQASPISCVSVSPNHNVIVGTAEGKVILKQNAPLDFNNTEKIKHTIYPNPSSGILTLKFPSQISSIEIFNVLGKKVFEQKTNGAQTEIDLTNQPKGLYFVRIMNEKSMLATEKIQIE